MDRTEGLGRFQRHYKKGTLLFLEGDVGAEMFVILAGQVLIYRVAPKKVRDGSSLTVGSEIQTIATLHEGAFFGEMALLDHQPRSTSAIAHTDVEVVAIDQENLEHIIAMRPEFAVRMLREMARRLRSQR